MLLLPDDTLSTFGSSVLLLHPSIFPEHKQKSLFCIFILHCIAIGEPILFLRLKVPLGHLVYFIYLNLFYST